MAGRVFFFDFHLCVGGGGYCKIFFNKFLQRQFDHVGSVLREILVKWVNEDATYSSSNEVELRYVVECDK